MPRVSAVNPRLALPCHCGLGVALMQSKSPKGSVKRASFIPADASALTDESRFTLPEPRLLETGLV